MLRKSAPYGGSWNCSKSCAVAESAAPSVLQAAARTSISSSATAVSPTTLCIVSGDRVTRCKPDPEIYLLAAEGLHLPSAECLVFEDARVGITAARRAGAGRIVALATTLPRHTLATQTEADVVIDDFASITDLNTLLL